MSRMSESQTNRSQSPEVVTIDNVRTSMHDEGQDESAFAPDQTMRGLMDKIQEEDFDDKKGNKT